MAEKKELTLEALQKKLDAMEQKLHPIADAELTGGQKQALLERKLHHAMQEAKKDTVKITLPFAGSAEEEEYAVCGVNGVLWQVKRGEEVEVPRCVAEVFQNAQKQKKEARERRQALQSKKEK